MTSRQRLLINFLQGEKRAWASGAASNNETHGSDIFFLSGGKQARVPARQKVIVTRTKLIDCCKEVTGTGIKD